MKKLIFVLLGAAVSVASVHAQTQSGKRQPPSRPIEVPQEENSQENRSTLLPKIELPEFVITGKAVIDPPDVEKGESEEEGTYRRGPEESTAGSRERETLDLGNHFKQNMFSGEPERNGNVSGSIGSFTTTRLQAAFGKSSAAYDYLLKADYSRTKGFIRNGDASGGGIGVGGSLVMRSETPVFDAMRVGGNVDLLLDKYRFYGSIRPETPRDIMAATGKVDVNSGVESPLPYHAELKYQALSVADSTTETTENEVRFDVGIQVPLESFPLQARFRATLGTVTTGSAGNISLMEIALESPGHFWNDFFASASIHGYTAKGMDGQSLSRLYPRLSLGYHITPSHTALGAYEPGVEYASLRSQLTLNPFLSGNAVIRHLDAATVLSGALESQWLDWLTTKLSLRYVSLGDYPLYDDPASTGFWALAYAGRTTMITYEVEAVANISPNDYFAVALSFTGTRNSVTKAPVPYVPEFQGSGLYRLTTPFALVVTPSVGYVHIRRSGVTNVQRLPGYFFAGLRLEYQALSRLTVFGDVRNLLDGKYEVWRGYRAEPLTVTLGASLRW